MDLHNIKTYLRPKTLQEVDWQPDWNWLAGGTWIFNEPQPQLRGLVDLQQLDWSEIDITSEGLTIGAMCVQNHLLDWTFPPAWTGTEALKDAVRELASFKLSHAATVGGNICLALSASTFAPVMVALGASYEIWQPHGESRTVDAIDFQSAPQQTILQPGEALRRIWIGSEYLEWQTSFKRMAVATAGYAIAIVVTAYNQTTKQIRFGIGGSVVAPRLIQFETIPTETEIATALSGQIPPEDYLEDETASAEYRRHITKVLMQRGVRELTQGVESGRRF